MTINIDKIAANILKESISIFKDVINEGISELEDEGIELNDELDNKIYNKISLLIQEKKGKIL